MLEKVKHALRITIDVFNPELLDLIQAAINDLMIVGAEFEVIPIEQLDDGIYDYEVPNPLVRRAIITYCKMNFGEPSDYEQLKASYDEQKAQMRENSQF